MKLYPRVIFSLLISLIFYGCDFENSDPDQFTGEVRIDLRAINGDIGGRTAKMLLDDADAILLTIEGDDGSSTEYSLTKIELYQVEGSYISQKISLPVGGYKITEFLVIDSDDNIKYIAPLEGSSQAQNVSHPLPISFTITADEITEIEIEVISTEELTLEDFGLAGFNLSEVNLFSFLINVSEKGNMEFLLTANVEVASDSYIFTKELLAIANNSVVIKDGFSVYELTVSREGYETFSYSFSRDSLAHYSSVPLTIELEPAIDPLWTAEDEITDARDGEVYQAIRLGDQVWMAENLRATTYNDGTPIEHPGTDIDAWGTNTSGAYNWYDNDEASYKDTYGGLYNWYAATNEKICPVGWHVPSGDEWAVLSDFLGGDAVAGAKMKEIGTVHWADPNAGATNAAGFNALPAGWAYFAFGHFSYLGTRALFWSSDEGADADHGVSRQIRVNENQLDLYTSSNSSNKRNGFSIRCLKN